MEEADSKQLIAINKEEDRKYLFEQYKLVVESLNKLNDIRETSNNFWTGLNGALIAGIAYLRDAEGIGGTQKLYFIWTALTLGIILSLSWLSYLSSIKRSVDIRNDMILQLEEYFPAKIFTVPISKVGRKEGGGSLSIKEMFVPGMFLIGYIFFSLTFYFYPSIIVK